MILAMGYSYLLHELFLHTGSTGMTVRHHANDREIQINPPSASGLWQALPAKWISDMVNGVFCR